MQIYSVVYLVMGPTVLSARDTSHWKMCSSSHLFLVPEVYCSSTGNWPIVDRHPYHHKPGLGARIVSNPTRSLLAPELPCRCFSHRFDAEPHLTPPNSKLKFDPYVRPIELIGPAAPKARFIILTDDQRTSSPRFPF